MSARAKKHTSGISRLEALSTISKAITSDLYIEDILKLIVTVTARVMKSKICSLMLLDEKTGELVIKATQSVSEAYNKKPNIKLGAGIAGMAAQKGEPIQVRDVRRVSRYTNRKIAEKEGLCSLLSVPLKVKNKVIGVLNSYTSIPHKFNKSEINTITAVANQAAIVIENARLLVESQVIKEELATRKAVERAKGILMRDQGLSEQAAFQRIQRYSMNTRRSMREIAEAIVLTAKMK